MAAASITEQRRAAGGGRVCTSAAAVRARVGPAGAPCLWGGRRRRLSLHLRGGLWRVQEGRRSWTAAAHVTAGVPRLRGGWWRPSVPARVRAGLAGAPRLRGSPLTSASE